MAKEAVKNGDAHNGNSKTVSFSAFKPHAHKAAEAVQFYKAAFGAQEVSRVTLPKRKPADQELPFLISAELKLGSTTFLVSDHSNIPLIKSGLWFNLETEDIEGAIANAVKAGGASEGEIEEGDQGSLRVGKVKDPYGVIWAITSPPPNIFKKMKMCSEEEDVEA